MIKIMTSRMTDPVSDEKCPKRGSPKCQFLNRSRQNDPFWPFFAILPLFRHYNAKNNTLLPRNPTEKGPQNDIIRPGPIPKISVSTPKNDTFVIQKWWFLFRTSLNRNEMCSETTLLPPTSGPWRKVSKKGSKSGPKKVIFGSKKCRFFEINAVFL